VGALVAGAADAVGTADGAGVAVVVPGAGVTGRGELGGGEAEVDAVPSVGDAAVLPLPLEQPDAKASKAPAVAMLTPKDANVWVLRMVNR